MRRTKWVVAIGAVLATLVVLPASSGAAPGAPKTRDRVRTYEGSTSQAQPLRVQIEKNGDVWSLLEAEFGFRMRCQDGTKFRLHTGWGWSRGPVLDDHGRFSFDSVEPFGAFHFSGRLGPKGGSGTVEDTEPALTPDEELMRCTSKERTWTVDRADGPVGTPPPAEPSKARTMHARVDRHGRAHVWRSWM